MAGGGGSSCHPPLSTSHPPRQAMERKGRPERGHRTPEAHGQNLVVIPPRGGARSGRAGGRAPGWSDKALSFKLCFERLLFPRLSP